MVDTAHIYLGASDDMWVGGCAFREIKPAQLSLSNIQVRHSHVIVWTDVLMEAYKPGERNQSFSRFERISCILHLWLGVFSFGVNDLSWKTIRVSCLLLVANHTVL